MDSTTGTWKSSGTSLQGAIDYKNLKKEPARDRVQVLVSDFINLLLLPWVLHRVEARVVDISELLLFPSLALRKEAGGPLKRRQQHFLHVAIPRAEGGATLRFIPGGYH